MRRPAAHRLDTLVTIALIISWALTFPAVRVGVRHCPPLLFAGLRCLIGGLIILPLAMGRGVRPRVREHWGFYVLFTLTNVMGLVGFQTLALKGLPAGMVAVLTYLQPLLVAVLARLVLGETLGPAKAVGLGVAFAGIVVVSSAALGGRVAPLPVVSGVCGAAAWAIGTIGFKKAAGLVDTRWATAIPFLVGGVVLATAGLLTEGPRIDPTPGFWLGLGCAGLLGTGLAWLLWFHLVAAGDAGQAASRIFFVPVLAVALGALLLGERLTAGLLVGAALVICGVWLVNRTPASAR